MKKILCFVLVLILTMSVAMTASAVSAEEATNALGSFFSNFSFELPKFATLDEAFSALEDFIKFEAIMVYVDEFHVYMEPFYEDFNIFLKGFGVIINGIIGSFVSG